LTSISISRLRERDVPLPTFATTDKMTLTVKLFSPQEAKVGSNASLDDTTWRHINNRTEKFCEKIKENFSMSKKRPSFIPGNGDTVAVVGMEDRRKAGSQMMTARGFLAIMFYL
jgi:hypothetical protein